MSVIAAMLILEDNYPFPNVFFEDELLTSYFPKDEEEQRLMEAFDMAISSLESLI